MLAVQVTPLCAFPKEIIQLVELGLFFPEKVVEGLKHGLVRFSLHGDFFFNGLDGVVFIDVFLVVDVRVVVLLRRAIAGLHHKHHSGEGRCLQESSEKLVGLHIVLFFNAQQHAEYHAKESCEQHLEGWGQQEGDGMGGIPEQGDGLGEDETVLDIPVDLL